MKHGKKYRESLKKYDSAASFELNEALTLVKTMAYAKFDETVDLSVKLNLKKSQSVRDTVVMPNQFRGEKRVLVFCKPEKEKEAQDAGAAFVGAEDLIEKIKGGWTDFDVAVATPDMMKDVGKLPKAKCEEIAKLKMPDLSANDVEGAMKIIAGTARSMGVEVEK